MGKGIAARQGWRLTRWWSFWRVWWLNAKGRVEDGGSRGEKRKGPSQWTNVEARIFTHFFRSAMPYLARRRRASAMPESVRQTEFAAREGSR